LNEIKAQLRIGSKNRGNPPLLSPTKEENLFETKIKTHLEKKC